MSKKISIFCFLLACALHLLIGLWLLVSVEKKIVISSLPVSQPIIEAVMVDKQALQQEVARLNAIESQQKAQEQARQQALLQEAQQAKLKRQKEEALLLALKKKNEQLKKEAEQKIAQAKLKEEQQKQRLAKLKEEQLKLEKEKQKKIEEARSAQKQAEQRQQAKMKQDLITQHALLMRNKIHQYWRQPVGIDINNLKCKVAVKLLPSGEVLEAIVIESSGDMEFDRSTELAVRKASPLPVPSNLEVAKEFRQFTFTFHPEAV